MNDFKPVNLDEDSKCLKKELIDLGRHAGRLVSRAAMEHGNHHPVTDMFDKVAQHITVALLELQLALKGLEDD